MVHCKCWFPKPRQGYGRGLPYLNFSEHYAAIDGIGRIHLRLTNTCDKCDGQIDVGNLHFRIPEHVMSQALRNEGLDSWADAYDLGKQHGRKEAYARR